MHHLQCTFKVLVKSKCSAKKNRRILHPRNDGKCGRAQIKESMPPQLSWQNIVLFLSSFFSSFFLRFFLLSFSVLFVFFLLDLPGSFPFFLLLFLANSLSSSSSSSPSLLYRPFLFFFGFFRFFFLLHLPLRRVLAVSPSRGGHVAVCVI